MMSWVNTLLDVGIIGLQMNQRSQLQQLQKQNADSAALQMIVQALREEIFKYKQATDGILALEAKDPKVAAGAMRLLEVRLDEFGLTPEMFPDLADKEYVASTTKLIHQNSHRMVSTLPEEDQKEIEDIATDALMQPRYAYYIENYNTVKKYREADKVVEELSSYNNTCLMNLVPFVLIFLIPFLCAWPFSLIFKSGGAILFSMFVGVIIAFGGWTYYKKNIAHNSEYKTAKKTVKELKNAVDYDLFAEVESELGTDYKHVTEMNEHAQSRMKNFFNESDFGNLVTG
jgi:hypothetical protein